MTQSRFKTLVLSLGMLSALCAAAPAQASEVEPIRIFAAASLKTALDQVSEAYETETGTSVTLAYGGSSTMARQIALGAPADLFLSANTAWMDYLSDQGMIVADSRADLLRNSLVVIASTTAMPLTDLAELPSALTTGRLAMAQTDAVPAGIYGKAALEAAGVWDEVAPRVAETDNVRAALALVSTGAAPFGIVYATDARADPRVRIAFAIDEALHPRIVYPVALVKESEPARAFLRYLQTPTATTLFKDQGFIPLSEH